MKTFTPVQKNKPWTNRQRTPDQDEEKEKAFKKLKKSKCKYE